MRSEGYAMIQRILVSHRTRRSSSLLPAPQAALAHLESILVYPQPEHSDEETEQKLSNGASS